MEQEAEQEHAKSQASADYLDYLHDQEKILALDVEMRNHRLRKVRALINMVENYE